MPTVQSLIDRGVLTRWSCSSCRMSAPADLEAIKAKAGPDFDLTDFTPRCRQPGCLGRVWFTVPLGAWTNKLLTAVGEKRLAEHGDWVFSERQKLRKMCAPPIA